MHSRSKHPFPRRLVLHIGATKTGTSALQVSLVRNRRQLRAIGICYPESESDLAAERGKITSGNGMAIAAFLNPGLPFSRRYERPDFAAQLLAAPAANERSDCILYSSEHIGFFIDDRLRLFAQTARQNGFEIEIVYFVRNIVDHAYSAYNQGVKRHRMTMEFETLVRTQYKCPFGDTLRRLGNLFEKDRIHVLSYDDEKSHLLTSMVQALGCPSEGIADTAAVINRSLTRAEVELMRFLSPHLRDDNECRKISDALIYAEPQLEVDRRASPQVVAWLRTRFQGDVDFVNRFAGRRLLGIAAGAHGLGDAVPETGSPSDMRTLVECALESAVAAPREDGNIQPAPVEKSVRDELVRASALAAAAALGDKPARETVRNLPVQRFVELMVSDMQRRARALVTHH